MIGTARRIWLLAIVMIAALGLPTWALHADAQTATPPRRVHIAAFAPWGGESLFVREAVGAARVLGERFGQTGQTIVRANTWTMSTATIAEMRGVLTGLRATSNTETDVLMLFVTSHGSPEGVAINTPATGRMATLSPARLSGMLAASQFRYRVVIVSACYSGVFSELLADDNTLVITAADSKHPSFGCSITSTEDWTFFGRAFFAEGLKQSGDLETAFRIAKGNVTERELQDRYVPSNPQIKGGKAVLAYLAGKG